MKKYNAKNIRNLLRIAPCKIALFIPLLGIATQPLNAKEPPAVIIGAGVGAGYNTMNITHAHIAKYPLQKVDPNDQGPQWTAYKDAKSDSWAVAWEFVLGYKHFINDYLGLRYYANIGVQHYKPISYKSKKEPIGIIDYSLNADLLIDFYEGEKGAFGVFGGVGLGGASFDNQAIKEYESIYNANAGIPIGASDITRHFLNVNFSAGVRVVFFQKVRISGGVRSCDSYVKGKRVCTTPTGAIGHAFEVVAKFPVMPYKATTADYVVSTAGQKVTDFRSRPEYKVRNPYRFTFRYVVEF